MNAGVKNLNVNPDFFVGRSAVPFTLAKQGPIGEVHSWNTNPKFFPEEMRGDSQRRLNYMNGNLQTYNIGEVAMPDQPPANYLKEDCHELTYEELKTYLESETYKKEGSIWNINKPYNGIFMRKETYDRIKDEFGVSISLVYPAADCAVVRFYDKEREIIGLTHSDANRTTSNIIGRMASYMKNNFGSNLSNVEVYVGAFAKDGWTYDKIPPFAVQKDEKGNVIGINDTWQDYLKFEDELYYIQYGNIIYDQLIDAGLHHYNIYFDPANTLFNKEFFSNAGSYHDKNRRDGRNLFGITFNVELLDNGEEHNPIIR